MSSTKKRRRYYDYSLLFITIVINIFGLIMIYSASSYTAQLKYNDAAYFVSRQALYVFAGFILMLIASKIDYHIYSRIAIAGYVVAAMLMLYVTFFGRVINGKRRWISIGSFSFQPTEVAKLAIILMISAYIVAMGKQINTWKGLLTVMAIDAPLAAIVAANNLSSGIILVGIAFVISFVATNKYAIYAGCVGAGVALIALIRPLSAALHAIGILRGYQYSRIMVWLDPSSYPQDGGYQVLQGLYAIGSGGLMGKGLGESIQKMGFVPEAQNDMIFSIICEELGLFGAATLVLLFLYMLYRIFVIANSAPDLFGSLLCVGVLAHIAIQVVLNIAVVTNTIPNTGITLPFISYGGTSVLMLLIEIGIVLSVSHQIRLDY